MLNFLLLLQLCRRRRIIIITSTSHLTFIFIFNRLYRSTHIPCHIIYYFALKTFPCFYYYYYYYYILHLNTDNAHHYHYHYHYNYNAHAHAFKYRQSQFQGNIYLYCSVFHQKLRRCWPYYI